MAPKQHDTEQLAPTNETAEAIDRLATALIAQQPVDRENLGLSAKKIKELTATPAALRYRLVPITSETGATFNAKVVESKSMPHGRITGLENYKRPAGVYKYASAGGLIPDGTPIMRDEAGMPPLDAMGEPAKDLSVEFKQFLWVEFYQRDLRNYVGKALQPHMTTADGLRTPWSDAVYWGHEAQDAAE